MRRGRQRPIPFWPLKEYIREVRNGGDWDSPGLRQRLFDCNGDGSFDREEHVAWRVADRIIMRAESSLPAIKAREEDVDFGLVELTITIPRPPEQP